MNTQSNQEIDDCAMQIINEIDIAEDLDPSYFDGPFEDNVDFSDLLMFEESAQGSHQQSSLRGSNSTHPYYNNVNVDGSAFYDTQEFSAGDYQDQSSSDEMSMSYDPAQQQIPDDLDQQIQVSMSKLVQSMHRSEMSRNMLGRQQQSMDVFGFGSLLNGASSIASGFTQSKSQLNNYMSHVGNSSMM